MYYAYAITRPEAWPVVFESGQRLVGESTQYLEWLQALGEVKEPRGIVFHDLDSATTVFSTHVLPAWTASLLVHIDPVIDDWKRIYLSALTTGMPPTLQEVVRGYYESLDRSDIATIVAHELTHHLSVFEDVPADAMWFEEGFCFYVPRKRLLPQPRFRQLMDVEKALVDTYAERLGRHPVWQFGESDKGGGFTEALFDYWRAISTVSVLIDKYSKGDGKSMLALFSEWKHAGDRHIQLHEFLIDALGVSEADQREVWLVPGNP